MATHIPWYVVFPTASYLLLLAGYAVVLAVATPIFPHHVCPEAEGVGNRVSS